MTHFSLHTLTAFVQLAEIQGKNAPGVYAFSILSSQGRLSLFFLPQASESELCAIPCSCWFILLCVSSGKAEGYKSIVIEGERLSYRPWCAVLPHDIWFRSSSSCVTYEVHIACDVHCLWCSQIVVLSPNSHVNHHTLSLSPCRFVSQLRSAGHWCSWHR